MKWLKQFLCKHEWIIFVTFSGEHQEINCKKCKKRVVGRFVDKNGEDLP